MISVRCPYCNVGLKIDEKKIPAHITSFKCPKCKKSISLESLNASASKVETDNETMLVHMGITHVGTIIVFADEDTPNQEIPLHEGINTIGRKSAQSVQPQSIDTKDRSMSRKHICIEVKKNAKGQYNHYLSDNNSKNHTLYNCNYLKDDEVVILNNDDEIVIGKTVLKFREN